MESFDLVGSLQALPETDPVEVDGIQFGGTCGSGCTVLTINILQTVCIIIATC